MYKEFILATLDPLSQRLRSVNVLEDAASPLARTAFGEIEEEAVHWELFGFEFDFEPLESVVELMTKEILGREISGLRREPDGSLTLLGYYAAYGAN